jgi:hypothetical protein
LNGSLSFGTGTISVGGSFINNSTFTHSTGTILFNSNDAGEVINPGNSTFASVVIAAPTGEYTVTASATSTFDFSITSVSSFTLQSNAYLTIDGIFTNSVGGAQTTWAGSTIVLDGGVPYTINTKIAGGDTYNNLVLKNNTDIRMWNSSATTSISDSESSLYSQDNAGINGELYIYGNYARTTGADYWSYATDFDGASIFGSERQVTVRVASGATTTFFGGTLEIQGSQSATTTITNQGSGTYSIGMYGGTLNALNYAFRNMDSYGLILSGTTTITSIANGDFELAVNSGSLISISSTTLNYNASMVVSGTRFATTTAISGVNVSVIGTTPSSWTFTTHRGNLDGEGFDSDGVDDCGSIRWDDSSCLLTQQTAFRWRNDDGGESVPNSEWFDSNWSKRKRITISNPDPVSYSDAVVEVVIPFDSDMQSDFDDLRITDQSGTTTVSFVREVYTASSEVTLWVKVPTLEASSDTVLYVYYGNGAALNAGVGTTTFALYDDFEDHSISEYGGNTSMFQTDTTFAYQGSYGLEAVNPNDRTTDGLYRTDVTVSQGQTIRYMQYINTTLGSGDETCTLFGVQSPGSNNNNYAVCLEQFGTDRVSIAKNVYDNDTNGTILSSTTISYATGWYEVEIDWDIDDSIDVSVFSSDTLVATTSVVDSSYTSGGIGFTYWFQNGGWDLYSARTLLSTEPTVTIGSEQVSGGASWLSDLNTKATGVDIGDTVRTRFVIENTGLTVSDAYKLEYAVKGASPSCEAVSASSYSEVPTQSSCNSSPICMISSSQITNYASTTDLLGGDGTFTYGQIIEDPSNVTQTLTLITDTYTEVEYSITPTVNASDSNYCFRVSDNGTDIDSYAKVAELQLRFAPNITALTFNGGSDISLSPGATTTIYATGTVSDLNGYADIIAATTTMFRSGVSESCSSDTNNCYISGDSLCSFTQCSGNTCDVSCSADFFYHADPTDIGTYAGQTWRAELEVIDGSGQTATATAPSIDLLTLRAISVDDTIDYGALEVNSDTGSYNATSTVQNIGNDSLDISIEGTDLSDGNSSTIPVTEQRFATSTFTYSSCVYCSQLQNSSTNYELDLSKPASTTPSVTDQIFWGIAIPFGVAGTAHQGTNIFYAIGD